MDVAVKVINFIRSMAKNPRLFQLLAKEMRVQHVELLFYTKVRWLSKGKCLSQLYEVKNEVEIFLRENKNNFRVLFHYKDVYCDACVPGRCVRPSQRHELVFVRPWCDSQRR